MIAIECNHVQKNYGPLQALDCLSLSVREGEILALLGPSGCGKTTLLRLLAGFERPDGGEIHIAGELAAGPGRVVPPERRGVGMVFQDYALFPHLSVADNVGFGLDRLPKDRRRAETEAALERVGLAGYSRRYPHELSGGERQRVALARALAPRPVVVLLDEPFSSLDADRRVQVREDVRAILSACGATAVFVTHDQEEALFMGDRLAVMRQGRVEQVAAPDEIFHCPATRFVAEFLGQTDFLPGRVTRDGIQTELGLLAQRVPVPPGTPVEVAVRGDDVRLEPWLAPAAGTPAAGSPAVVDARRFEGAQNVYRVRLPSGQVLHSIQPHTRLFPAGTPVRAVVDPHHALACFVDGRSIT
jgi:iron(III) transport system ATP-binding protein